MRSFLIILIFNLFLTSCGSIKKYEGNDIVAISIAQQLEGSYEIYPENIEIRNYNNAYSIFNGFSNNEEKENINYKSFEISVNNDDLVFIFKSQDNADLKVNYKYKIEKNGFVRISNKSKISGVPYLLGGIQIKKIELGKNILDQLIVTGTEIDESAVLLIPVSLPKSNFIYKFKKIK
ncbi:hypothetical protein [Chryseobacterium sp. MDT2-18]|uniref:hypothetical protein n=1 Tax=Chryseobacterium sp. MDT2-18 TaxID=1259136 RepID=UPI002784853E|nr:hypothetical protein [Chryseobacterium sp. MDT2-18]MDQ0477860.1 hypothetical protein [Chryseobacterium sp. MDT2-18]